MDDGSPTLEVGFEINFGDSFGNLKSLDSILGETAAEAVRQFNRIKSASDGALNLGGVTAQMTAFGNASTQAGATASAAMAKAEKAGESLSRSMERQINTFGMTRAAAAALAAEEQGLTELAGRLRDQEATLTFMRQKSADALRAEAVATRAFGTASSAGLATASLGMAGLGASTQGARIAMLDMTHVGINMSTMLATGVNPMRALMMESGRLATAIQYGGGSIGGLIKQFAAMIGILKVTQDAELSEAATKAATTAATITATAERAKAGIAAAAIEIELAEAAQRVAVTETETAAASMRLAGAHEAQTIAATQLTIAENALAGAQARAAETAVAASAAETTALGPVGIALAAVAAAAVAVYVAFRETAKSTDASTAALDKSVDKLKKDAEQTDIDRQAKDLYAHSEEGLVAALRDRMAAQDEEIKKSRTQGEQDNLLAQTTMRAVTATRQQTEALLEQALAQAQIDQINSQRPGEKGDLAAMRLAQSSGRVAALQQAMVDNAKKMADAEIAFQRSLIELAQDAAKVDALDPTAKIKRFYDEKAKAAVAAAYATVAAGGKITTALTIELEQIERNKNAAVKAEEERQAALKKTQDQIGRNITLEQGRKIAESIGGHVTSSERSYGDQQRLYDKYMAYKAGDGPWAPLAAKPGSSYHELGQAVDVAKSDGVTLKKLVAAYRAAGVSLVEALDEGDHYHIAWKKVGDAAKQQSAEVTAAAREATAAAAGEAQIANLNKLADAYARSGAAALIAQAQLDAQSSAIKRNGDAQAAVNRQVQIAIAQRVVDAAKDTAAMREQTAAQAKVNDAVAAGLVPASKAAQMVQDQIADVPLLAAIDAAQQRGLVDEAKKATQALDDQRRARAENRAEQVRAQFNADTSAGNDQLAVLQEELRLVGATDAVRTHTLATVQATQDAIAKGYTGAQLASYVAQQVQIADTTQALRTAQDNYNNSLSYTADLLSLINANAQDVASGLSSAFGNVGEGVGQALTALSGYAATQAKLDLDHKAALKTAGKDAAAAAKVDILYAKQSASAREQAIGQTINGLKSLFKEHSTGYKVMTAIEKAYAAFQAVETALSIAREFTKTATTVTQSGVRTTANTSEGASKIFAELGPWAFPVVAAMIAVLVALGAKGGGGGTVTAPPTSDDLQAAAGTGTVLGSPKDKSASIANSLEIVAANTNSDLQYSNQMLIALRSIDTSIGAMAATVAKQINVSGSLFDTSGLGLGSSGHKGFLGLIGGSSTTKSLYDLGIQLNSASVASIIANGITGLSYQVVQQVKTKSGFLGIGGGTKTSYSTTNGALDPSISASIQQVIASLENGLVTAANAIGLDGAKAMLDGFNVSIGKISFNGLDAQGIEDELNAIFSSIGDQMATKLLPSLASMQKAGEGLFETFTRVAKEYETVDVELQSIGTTFGAVGVGSIQARDALVQLFGGLDDFVTATDAFRDNFLSDAEQIAPIQAAVIAQMQALGVSGITTREQFKNLVLGLDLTTDAGRQMYASLLGVAPAFDKVLDYFDNANKTLVDGLQSTADKFSGFADSLQKYRDTLFATDAAQAGSYGALRAKFVATAALASTGDATALGGLEGAGKDFLTAARNNASTLQQYQRDVALVAQGVDKGIFAATETADYAQLQLDALKNATSILQQISDNTAALAAQPVPAAPAPATTVVAATDSASTATIEAQNATIIQQNGMIVDSLQKLERYWSRIDGDGVLVRTDADSPINVVSAS